MEAQLVVTKVLSLRGLRLCISLARSSFPVPVSPRISTVESVWATVSTCFSALFQPKLSPTLSERELPWSSVECVVAPDFPAENFASRRPSLILQELCSSIAVLQLTTPPFRLLWAG